MRDKSKEILVEPEIWITLLEINNLIQVSSYGRVRTLDRWTEYVCNGKTRRSFFKGKILKPDIDKDGYHVVSPCINGIRYREAVHRLVCIAFHTNPGNKPCVNHIDSNRSNNYYKNLEWATWKENSIHGNRHGFRVRPEIPPMPGALNPRARKIGQFTMGNLLIREYDYMKMVKDFGFSTYMVREATKGHRDSYKGFKWKYL